METTAITPHITPQPTTFLATLAGTELAAGIELPAHAMEPEDIPAADRIILGAASSRQATSVTLDEARSGVRELSAEQAETWSILVEEELEAGVSRATAQRWAYAVTHAYYSVSPP